LKAIEQYLNDLESRQHDPLATPVSTINPRGSLDLPIEIVRAVNRGWRVCLVQAKSRYFRRQAIVGYPTCDLVQLRKWHNQCGSDCIWAAEMSLATGLLILEVGETGSSAIRFLSGDDASLRSTL
jgi:hypothetical protein